MKQFEEQLSIKVSDVICDLCHQSTKDNIGNFEYATLIANWGYSSSKDGDSDEFHYCEKCYDLLLDFIQGQSNQSRENETND